MNAVVEMRARRSKRLLGGDRSLVLACIPLLLCSTTGVLQHRRLRSASGTQTPMTLFRLSDCLSGMFLSLSLYLVPSLCLSCLPLSCLPICLHHYISPPLYFSSPQCCSASPSPPHPPASSDTAGLQNPQHPPPHTGILLSSPSHHHHHHQESSKPKQEE